MVKKNIVLSVMIIVFTIVIGLMMVVITNKEAVEQFKIDQGLVAGNSEDSVSYLSRGTNCDNCITDTGINTNLKWVYEVIEQDELNATIEYMGTNKTHHLFNITPDIYNQTKVDKVGYSFKADLNTTTKTTRFIERSYKKAEIRSTYYFSIPINETSFLIRIGENSTLISGSGNAVALGHSFSNQMCKTSDGMLHTVYLDTATDAIHANSSDEGITWQSNTARAGTVETPGIICGINDELYIYYEEGNDIDIVNSTDGGITWSSPTTIYDQSLSYSDPSGATDLDGILHFSYISSGKAYYTNSTGYGTITDINTNFADDSDYCDIIADNTSCVYAVCIGTDQDDMDIFSPCINGWGDTNRVEIYNGGTAYSGDHYGPSITISNSGRFYVTSTIDSDLHFCNSTLSNLNTWSCQVVDSDNSQNPSIMVSKNEHIIILYDDALQSNEPSSTTEVYYANSTDGSMGANWDFRTQLEANSGKPQVLDQLIPSTSRNCERVDFVYYDQSDDVYHSNFTIDLEDNCLSDNIAPEMQSIKINATTYRNTTSDNLTVYHNATDDNDDEVTVHTNYLLNGKSMTVLNIPFGGASDTTHTDISGYGNDGTEITDSEINLVAGKFGVALNFTDGISAKGGLEIADSSELNLDSNYNFSIEFWYNPFDLSDTTSVLLTKKPMILDSGAEDGAWGFQVISNTLRFQTETDAGTNTNADGTLSTTHQWYYIVGTYNTETGNMSLYINGSLVSTATPTSIGTTSYPIYIGSDNEVGIGLGNSGASGIIDEVKIWNITLTDEQISTNYLNYSGQIIDSSMTYHDSNWSCTGTPIDSNGLNGTPSSCNTVRVIDPCVCRSDWTPLGDWDVLGSDLCALSEKCNMMDNSFSCLGDGHFINKSYLFNYTNRVIGEGCRSYSYGGAS